MESRDDLVKQNYICIINCRLFPGNDDCAEWMLLPDTCDHVG